MKLSSDLTDEELKEEFETYHRMVNNTQSFSVGDLRRYHALIGELHERGIDYRIQESVVYPDD